MDEEQALVMDTTRIISVTTHRSTSGSIYYLISISAHIGTRRSGKNKYDHHEDIFNNDLQVESGTLRKQFDIASAIVFSPASPSATIS